MRWNENAKYSNVDQRDDASSKPFHFNCKVAIFNHDIDAVDNQLHDKMDLTEVSICMRFVTCSDRKTEHTSRAQKNTVKRHD